MTQTNDKKVLFSTHGPVAHLVLNRAEKLNAIDDETLALLHEYVAAVNLDKDIRCVVVRGEGRAFSAGADLDLVESMAGSPDRFDAFLEQWMHTFEAIESCRVPTVAAVADIAFAGGFELMQVCDFVVLGERARIGDNHAVWGLYPGGGSVQRLPRLIGQRRAKWLLLSGDHISPEDAKAYGLVNEVVAPDTVVARATELAEILASRNPVVTERIKWAMVMGSRTDVATALRVERPITVASLSSPESRAGLEAFRRRTPPTNF